MKLTVFLGPTLPAAEARAALPEVEVRPPATRGDVLRAVTEGATLLGIVDGYFDQVESVTHKEILWAMSQGAHVLGAASMGALRAAELASFGMVGVGEIFDRFRRGDLTDDDEVAVTHAPAEDGYRKTSEAMVDIRATLDAALDANILSRDSHAHLTRAAKSLFYPDRVYPTILARAAESGASPADLASFRAFLPAGRVDQKRRDALTLLDHLRALRDQPPSPLRVRYFFSHTDAWETLRNHATSTTGLT